jgi:hypothetical protein
MSVTTAPRSASAHAENNELIYTGAQVPEQRAERQEMDYVIISTTT